MATSLPFYQSLCISTIYAPSTVIYKWNWVPYSYDMSFFIFFVRNPERFRDRGAREHYRSHVQSRSISRSPSPRDERDYRRSHNRMENGRSPHSDVAWSYRVEEQEEGKEATQQWEVVWDDDDDVNDDFSVQLKKVLESNTGK
ncbi:hypothetical protein ACLB2K_040050 [Fragaria x ananassa]